MGWADNITGALAGNECGRALARPRLLWWRLLAPLPTALVLLVAGYGIFLWEQLLGQQTIDVGFLGISLRGIAYAVSFLVLVFAALATPALLAGSMAEEKVRGTLMLLLISKVSSWEIVMGRLLGGLTWLGVLLAANVPLMALTSGIAGLRLLPALLLIVLPFAVSFGLGGLTLLASSLARRGREALVLVYGGAIGWLFLAHWIDWYLPSLAPWMVLLDPLTVAWELIAQENNATAIQSIGAFLVMGLVALRLAAWRLFPSYRKQLSEASVKRRWRVRLRPAVSDRPMLWKEIHVEQPHGLGWILRALGLFAKVALLGSFLYLGFSWLWSSWTGDTMQAGSAAGGLEELVGMLGTPLSWFVQWSMAVAAAVSIASERERHTWDGLLTSPLEGAAIVYGKIAGGCRGALSWLVIALVCWSVALVCGALPFLEWLLLVASTLVGTLFSATMGVAFSLRSTAVTKAVFQAIMAWMLVRIGGTIAAGVVTGVVVVFVEMLLWQWHEYFSPGVTVAPPGTTFALYYVVLFYAARLLIEMGVAIYMAGLTSRRFDTLAGRADGRGFEMVLRNRIDSKINADLEQLSATASADPLSQPPVSVATATPAASQEV